MVYGRRWFAWVALASTPFGCSVILGKNDGFSERLEQGCGSFGECEGLRQRAEGRVAHCDSDAVDAVPCAQARADLAVAARYANEREQRELAIGQMQLEEQHRREEDRQQAQEAAHQKQVDAEQQEALKEREARAQSRSAWEQETRARDLEYLRLLGPDKRAKKVRACARQYEAVDCEQLVSDIAEAIHDDKEAAKLAKLNETALRAAEAEESGVATAARQTSSSADAPLQCCDGQPSPTCTCNGPHGGCCSHHHGVCGCAK
jgi:hypothetical protein